MLAQNVNATKQKRKPPAGVDPHMLGRRLTAASGVGKRGADSKASTRSSCLLVAASIKYTRLDTDPRIVRVQASTSAVQRAGVNRSFTGMGSRGSSAGRLPMSRTASGSVLDTRQEQDAGVFEGNLGLDSHVQAMLLAILRISGTELDPALKRRLVPCSK